MSLEVRSRSFLVVVVKVGFIEGEERASLVWKVDSFGLVGRRGDDYRFEGVTFILGLDEEMMFFKCFFLKVL